MSEEDNIIREVEDDLRRERYERLWKQYGPFVTGLVVVVIVGMLGWQQWNAWQDRQRAREAEALIAAAELLEEEKGAEAAEAFADLAAKAGPGYRAVARLHEGEAWLAQGNPDAALAAFDALAADGSVDPHLRGLAALKGALLLADSATPEDLGKRLVPALRPASPWRFSAQEVIAYAYYRAGKAGEARNGYEALVNEFAAPGHIRDRARRMLGLIASEQAQRGDATPAGAEAPKAEAPKAAAPEKAARDESAANGNDGNGEGPQ